MPIRKVQRRTLSKVERQLLEEKEDEINRVKQLKKEDQKTKRNQEAQQTNIHSHTSTNYYENNCKQITTITHTFYTNL